MNHGFQCPDWQFDGDDLIAVVRAAFGVRRARDAKFLTFNRWRMFRQLTSKNDGPILEVTAKKDATLVIATATDQESIDLKGWQSSPLHFTYNDARNIPLKLYSRALPAGQILRLPRGNWTGAILIVP